MANIIQYKLLDPVFEAEIEEMADGQRAEYIFLHSHPEYRNYFKVDSFDPFFLRDFFDLIGEYQAISMFKLPALATRAEERGYKLVFMTDPRPMFNWLDELNEPFPLDLSFDLYPFQTQGFNFLKDKKAGIVEWSTGTGKSVYGCARVKYLLAEDLIDTAIIVSKKHNRINWQRQLKTISDIDAALIGFRWREQKDGSQKLVELSGKADVKRTFRSEQYSTEPVFITNYEKFRDDTEALIEALKGQRVYLMWDEMPTKLKTRSTKVYKGAQKVVKACRDTYQDMLSATPIENSPEDLYNCVKLMDKTALDSRVLDFRQRYAASWNAFAPNKVDTWNTVALRELGMRLAHMTHKASKYHDPEIAAQFPTEHWDPIYIEMSPEDRKLYDDCLSKIISDFWDPNFTPQNILQRMNVLQLICNNPYVINLAGGDFSWAIRTKTPPTDKYCAKLEMLRDDAEAIPGKIVLFTAFNDLGAKPLTVYLKSWGHEYVLYDGTDKAKQEAQDRFMTDPNIKFFVSSDQGSDSISLEVAETVINYDLPWKYSTKLQRVNRVNRITSKIRGGIHGTGIDHVYYRDYIMENTVEERKVLILNRKKSYADATGAETNEQMEAISVLSKNELWFMLTGEDR